MISPSNYKGSSISFQAKSELSDQETVVYPDQLESTSLALRFRLKPDVLHNGKVILKCVATINHIHAVTIKEIRATVKAFNAISLNGL
ncbi:uncharacterized protein CDAR_308821 [Caerostris darwini]|uniref:Uncharacterized protein n=1 Tax=Caerostris darwini TaxID=1538125 RepID=A0AAV4TYH1_9ARAC|nr:uncharacterized protein CDAR_308821 [Caerostris darwini]